MLFIGYVLTDMCCGVFLFFFSSRRRHTRCALVTGVQTCALPILGTQHIDEILAVWYPTHKTFLDLSDAPGAKESYRLRGACVAYAVIHRCSGSNSPLDGNG